MQDWKRQRGNFAAIAFAPTLWLLLCFAVPLAIMWAFSFGSNEGLTSIKITGTAIEIKSTQIKINGKMVAIEGAMMTEVKGNIVKVGAAGILTLKGSLTKIN